jgi:hypothetical protein
LAEYSFFHTPEELAKMLIDVGTSSQWAAIKEAVSQLELKRNTLRSKRGRDNLMESILQIALDNRLVSIIV